MVSHPLDNPIWFSLTTEQYSFARGGPFSVRAEDGRSTPDLPEPVEGTHPSTSGQLALRYEAEVAPFIAIERSIPAVEARARELVSPGEVVYFVGVRPDSWNGWSLLNEGSVWQMLWEPISLPPRSDDGAIELTADDAEAMVDLTTLAFPGFFRRRTHELGRYLGIKRAGQLIAMAGERMRATGLQEISAVCTHPEHTGRGYAAKLSTHLIQTIREQGRQPFLHVGSANSRAQSLYARLGFVKRAELGLWHVRRNA